MVKMPINICLYPFFHFKIVVLSKSPYICNYVSYQLNIHIYDWVYIVHTFSK